MNEPTKEKPIIPDKMTAKEAREMLEILKQSAFKVNLKLIDALVIRSAT